MPYSYTDVLPYHQHCHPQNSYFACFHFIMKCEIIGRDKVFNGKKIFTVQKKTVKIILVQNMENQVEVCLGDENIYLLHVNTYFH